ncbi:MAG TPA: DNA polymerase Y family protein [Rhizomicrobium sp.]
MLAADQAARRAGLTVGMPATKAQALVEDLVILDADPEADGAALHRLAVWMQRHYAPLVTVYHPDGLVLDISGVAHLFGGEAAMLKDMLRKLASVGCGARIAAAPSYGAAHALARCVATTTYILAEDKVSEALDLLPTAALRLPGEMVAALKKLGFERIGELNATPRAPLALRFGSMIGARLDQAYGRVSEPLDPIIPPETPHVRKNFAEPIGAPETIARYTGVLVEQMAAELEVKGLGARKLDLLLFRVDNHIEAIRVGTSRPVRDVKRLTKLLCDRIEKVDPGFGVETMTLTAFVAEPLTYRASVSALGEPEVKDVSGLIDTLSNRIGEQQLYRLTPVESDVPERAVRRVTPLTPASGASWPAYWPRPTRLLDPPEAVETVALLPDHPPVAFTWRGMRRRVARADGPERIFGEWWKSDIECSAVRDYFQIEDDVGERYWLFRAGDGEDQKTGSQRWFLHGVFA